VFTGPACQSLDQSLQRRSENRRNWPRPTVFAVHEDVNEVSLRQRFTARSEQSDLVADTGASDLRHFESGSHLVRKSDRIKEAATGFRADADRLPGMNVKATFADEPGVDHGVEEGVVLDIVDVPVDIVVLPSGRDGLEVDEIALGRGALVWHPVIIAFGQASGQSDGCLTVGMPDDHQRPNAAAVGLVLGAIFSIQFGAAVATDLFPEIGAAGVVFMRAVTSAVLLALIWRPGISTFRENPRLLLVFGVALAGMNLCFYESIARIPLGTAVTLEFIGPLTVALVKSRRRRDWIWAILAGIGIVLLTGGIGGESLDPLGVVLALAAGFFWGSYILIGKRMGTAFSGAKGLAIAMAVSAALTAPIGIAEGGTGLLDPRVLAIAIAVGVFSSALPFTLELEAMRRLPSSVFGVMMSLEPAVAAVVGLILLGQGIVPVEFVAIALVVAASAGALRSRAAIPVEP
jgi:inner membrane transporter RhtA